LPLDCGSPPPLYGGLFFSCPWLLATSSLGKIFRARAVPFVHFSFFFPSSGLPSVLFDFPPSLPAASLPTSSQFPPFFECRAVFSSRSRPCPLFSSWYLPVSRSYFFISGQLCPSTFCLLLSFLHETGFWLFPLLSFDGLRLPSVLDTDCSIFVFTLWLSPFAHFPDGIFFSSYERTPTFQFT